MKQFLNIFRIAVLFLFASLLSDAASAQEIAVEILNAGQSTSLRGLSVVNDNIIWVSGSNGKVGRSTNAGKNWTWITVKGFEKTEFRDIEAFGPNTAVIMAVGEPAFMLRTSDGGETWKVVYENAAKGMFLDAMDFATPEHGVVIGDPINGQFFMAESKDGGQTWKEITRYVVPKPDSGEAFFAASGTNIRLFRNDRFYMVTGGKRSRLIGNDWSKDVPMKASESSGAFSVAVYDNGRLKGSNNIVVVGGDYKVDTSTVSNCFYSTNGGKTWKEPKIPPHGYRSCVEYITDRDLVTCGISGVDISRDAGKSWKLVSKESFNTCRFALAGAAVYLVGDKGKIGKLVLKTGLER